jgi:hypothetical protein
MPVQRGSVMWFLVPNQIRSVGAEASPKDKAHRLDPAVSGISTAATTAGTFILRRARYFNETRLDENEPVVSGTGATNIGGDEQHDNVKVAGQNGFEITQSPKSKQASSTHAA